MKEDTVQAPVANRHGAETNLKKLIRLHLADPDHVITEEDLRNVEVGVTAELPDEELSPKQRI